MKIICDIKIEDKITIKPSKSKRTLKIFFNTKHIASIDIQDAWDMIKDTLSKVYTNSTEYGLIRRKAEAQEAITYIIRHQEDK